MRLNNPIKAKMNSAIGWLGGKTRLRPTIINCMPKHDCYVEIFCGSATVFFGKPPVKIEIINDINHELINLFKVISGTYFDEAVRQEFVEYVKWMPAARESFVEWQKWPAKKLDELNPAQRAFVYYYCIKKGFSSIKQGGYEASPLSKRRYNMNTDFEKFRRRFSTTNAQIEQMDFRNLIEKYSDPRARVFFFGDPPYFVADGTNYYEFVFGTQDHQEFKECCDKIHANGNQFLITYDDVQGVIDLYADYYIYRTDPIIYSASEESVERTNEKTELFITNYDLHAMLRDKEVEKSKGGPGRGDMFVKDRTDAYAGDNIRLTDKEIVVEGCIGLQRIN